MRTKLLFLALVLSSCALGYWLDRPTKTELHEEFIRGAVTAISYQHIKGVPPSGFWLDSAFDFGYITSLSEFDSVSRAFAYRVMVLDTIKCDTALTRACYWHK